MVEAPLVAVEADPRRLDQFDNLAGQIGIAGRGIFEIEQRLLCKPMESRGFRLAEFYDG